MMGTRIVSVKTPQNHAVPALQSTVMDCKRLIIMGSLSTDGAHGTQGSDSQYADHRPPKIWLATH